ncbi:MAG: glycosyltransferase family 9 protein [Aminipila sp.]
MNILVEIHHGLGDIVQMQPMIEKLRETYANAKISMLVASSEHAMVINGNNLVDNFYFLNLKHMSKAEFLCLIYKLRKERFDIGIVSPMTNLKKGKVLMHVIGCRKVFYPIKDSRYYKNNSVMQGLEILNQIGIETSMKNPRLTITDEIKELSKKLLKDFNCEKLVSICVGTGMVSCGKGKHLKTVNAKSIDFNISIEIAEYLICKGFKVLLLGGKQEKEFFQKGNYKLAKGIISFLGKTSIQESMALISSSRLVIGGDTGLIHIAGAMNVETITYYAASGPNVGPFSEQNHIITAGLDCQYCYGTDKLFACEERKCLKYITSKVIINEIESILI